MEHPLRVDEFSPAEAARPAIVEPDAGAALEAVAHAAPLPPLPNLAASDVLFLRPGDTHYADYLPAANRRKQLSPALRAVCKTEHAVAVMVDWIRTNHLSFAVRCGGHSYEGFSQSVDVVIDVRGLNTITVDKSAGLVTVGSGVSLYQIYRALAAKGLALQAGSCPTVGISGHLTGRRAWPAGAFARPDLRQPAAGRCYRQPGAAAAGRRRDGVRSVLGLPRRWRRQFWYRHAVHDPGLSIEQRAGVRCLLEAVASARRAIVRSLAKLGAERAGHDHLDHESRPGRRRP